MPDTIKQLPKAAGFADAIVNEHYDSGVKRVRPI